MVWRVQGKYWRAGVLGLKGKKEKAIIKKAEGFLRPGELYVVMTDGLKAVYIENVGEPFVFKGSCGDVAHPCVHTRPGGHIVRTPGEATALTAHHMGGGGAGLFSSDTVNGKCLFLAEDLDL